MCAEIVNSIAGKHGYIHHQDRSKEVIVGILVSKQVAKADYEETPLVSKLEPIEHGKDETDFRAVFQTFVLTYTNMGKHQLHKILVAGSSCTKFRITSSLVL